jgi:hypothetical protein
MITESPCGSIWKVPPAWQVEMGPGLPVCEQPGNEAANVTSALVNIGGAAETGTDCIEIATAIRAKTIIGTRIGHPPAPDL